MRQHGPACTCDVCMERDERLFTVWHDEHEQRSGETMRIAFPVMDVTRHVDLGAAYALSVRLNELHYAMQIVESCGASVELTEAVNRLGERMHQTQVDLENACKSAMGE